jgi:hypothetical protein
MRLNRNKLAISQGIFYTATGLWPVFDLKSFEKVTGPKTDHWLVKTVGLLIATTGSVLLLSGLKKRKVPDEVIAIAAGQAGVLASISLIYSLVGRISKIYLLDTLTESAIISAWTLAEKSTASTQLTGEKESFLHH